MKKTITIVMSLFLIAACGNKEKTKEEIELDYVQKAQKYIDVKFANDLKSKETVKSFKVMKVDSIYNISTYQLEDLKMRPYQTEYLKEVGFRDKLIEIDQSFTGEISDQTNHQIEKVKVMQDSLTNWLTRSEKMNKKDKVSKGVQFLCDVENLDGSKNKGIKFVVYFDKEDDIDAKIMKYIFN